MYQQKIKNQATLSKKLPNNMKHENVPSGFRRTLSYCSMASNTHPFLKYPYNFNKMQLLKKILGYKVNRPKRWLCIFVHLFPLRVQCDSCLGISKCFIKLDKLQKCCSAIAGQYRIIKEKMCEFNIHYLHNYSQTDSLKKKCSCRWPSKLCK